MCVYREGGGGGQWSGGRVRICHTSFPVTTNLAVVFGGQELHRAVAQLRPLEGVGPPPLVVQVREVVGRDWRGGEGGGGERRGMGGKEERGEVEDYIMIHVTVLQHVPPIGGTGIKECVCVLGLIIHSL